MFSLYASGNDDKHRYVLGDPGERPLFTFGVNPHIANRTKSDRTVSLVRNVARNAGYDGFVMFNVYPVRSKTVDELPAEPDLVALEENACAIDHVLKQYRSPHIWAAWGNDVGQRPYLADTVAFLAHRLAKYEPKWLCFGKPTKLGHPRHPSRLSHEWQFHTFDISCYESSSLVSHKEI